MPGIHPPHVARVALLDRWGREDGGAHRGIKVSLCIVEQASRIRAGGLDTIHEALRFPADRDG